ncbi:MAG: hypothetical protein KDA28_16615, partial [Phycisphaerales bacterium]|nr:hypothetical protein [Phycisphaerales bacterium]
LDGRLVGGLYGVSHGALFAGESMFMRAELGGTDASKVCLVHLVAHLRHRGYMVLDTQMCHPHLEQFGGVEVPRRTYLTQVERAVACLVTWGTFDPARAIQRNQPEPHSGQREA